MLSNSKVFLEVVKQEMARVNTYILGISGLKWTGMGEFTSDDHYIYYCGQESLRRNGVALIVSKSKMQYLGEVTKITEMISVCFQGKPFNITVIQVYAPTTNAEEAKVEQVCEGLQDLLKRSQKRKKKNVLLIIGDWSEIPGVTGKFGLEVQSETG